MNDAKIAFIGCGNMGQCLIGGLIQDNYPAENIRVSDPDSERLAHLRASCAINTTSSNLEAVSGADIVILAVKPQMLKKVVRELADTLATNKTLIISIAAGIKTDHIRDWVRADSPVVRVMPNTPALVKSGAAALYATDSVSEQQRDIAESIMRSTGLTLWLQDESLMDAVTAVSGSGPAYFFLVMEAMEEAAVALGLPAEQARLLTLQTAFGAAKMALESSVEPAALRVQVTSPGGTTQAALDVMQKMNLRDIFSQALDAAAQRSRELADEFGAS